MRRLSIRPVAVLGVGVALGLTGCGSDETRTCRQSGGATFCLVEDGGAYRAEGHGFRPGSQVRLTLDGADDTGAVPPIRADRNGDVPAQGALGVLGGREPQRVRVTGTSASGRAARFSFVVPIS